VQVFGEYEWPGWLINATYIVCKDLNITEGRQNLVSDLICTI